MFRTITLSYCCRVTPVLTVHFVHRSCIILVVLDSVVILFTRRPCPADMEPTDDGAGHRPCAMTEMIFLFIASLAGMMIVPCNRALVLQCSSLPSMAYLRFPLACRILLTVVLAPLASAWTSSNRPGRHRDHLFLRVRGGSKTGSIATAAVALAAWPWAHGQHRTPRSNKRGPCRTQGAEAECR